MNRSFWSPFPYTIATDLTRVDNLYLCCLQGFSILQSVFRVIKESSCFFTLFSVEYHSSVSTNPVKSLLLLTIKMMRVNEFHSVNCSIRISSNSIWYSYMIFLCEDRPGYPVRFYQQEFLHTHLGAVHQSVLLFWHVCSSVSTLWVGYKQHWCGTVWVIWHSYYLWL